MTQPVTASPRGPSKWAPAITALLAITGGLVWLLPVVTFVFLVPKFEEVIAKFDTSLPLLTRFILGVAGGVARYWFLLGAAWVAVTAGLVIASVAAKGHWPVWLSAAFAGISLVLVFVVESLVVIGLFLPLAHLVESVG